ncbi:tetrahydrofolate dehydrogenase/cyclohydrolase catalytic domain-containing protein [Penicillium cf. griseofulvum]|uniref:methylenetetrahydrofolate dehydrogenase (NADP(+)) n=1 Tax=Penicillium cf. griseofulvum TaxID=2972120 RepID=A0A9W9T5T2_9EURO|nr:tetrahydrofolate dehydrogenase/cyclohydrolase catalytic domain-containing protein [Penicillium cf. griseofulvum]KAJ5428156.1 tetrahydrofolate dehydrogenase/cyclohydrolase catalytic domain-containing protein [Penicillium cf. griseofulvum]
MHTARPDQTHWHREMSFFGSPKIGATLLRGDPVVRDIKQWCLRKGHNDEIEPALAVLYFNTDSAAEHYAQIKAHVAAQAGVGYWAYEMPPGATSAEVKSQIQRLNQDKNIHGILIQRPLPEHLDELKIMASVDPLKNIEEYCDGQTANIVADAFTRLLSKYGKLDLARQSTIHIAGFGNMITDGFISHMRHHYPHVRVTPHLPRNGDKNPSTHQFNEHGNEQQHSLLVTELHQGPGYITTEKVPSDVLTIVDLGFYTTANGTIVGDVDHKVYEEAGLAIAPTPGGLLPVLLWVMMERTIRAKLKLVGKRSPSCCGI